METNRMRRSLLLIPLAALAACAGIRKGDHPVPRPASEYRIGREDVLEIVVWREPELTRTMPVRPDGRIALPLAGEMEAAGLTPAELQAKVKDALAPYVKDVTVAVLVREINGPRFYVLGEVPRPGGFPLRGAMTVTQALALAGGKGEFAGNDVMWLRQNGDGKSERVRLSYRELVQGEAEGALWLGPGDVLYVP
jgi:polysaccharide export outer membrane protein